MHIHLPTSVFIELGLIILIAAVVKSVLPRLLGIAGESKVRRMLDSLDPSSYVILNDLYLPNGRGTTSQIDHVVVSQFGVFVIETKNYSGRIFGKETDQSWTVTYGRRKARLKNPFHQNYAHLQAIKEVLIDYQEVPLVSMVVFSKSADLRVDVKPGTELLYTTQVVKAIRKYSETIMSPEKIDYVVNTLRTMNVTDKKMKRQHVKNIRSAMEANKESVKKGVCPKCGGKLIKKPGKYGSFTACSNYPKCRFTQKGA
jgi:hypothetical protein